MKFNNIFKRNNAMKIKKIKFWKTPTFIFTIIAFVTFFFWIISFCDIVVLTTIHSYTFGALFGFNSSFFYLAIILFSIMKIFDWEGKITLKHFFFSFTRYLVFSFVIAIFAGMIYNVSSYEKMSHAGNNLPKVFDNWFKDYSNVISSALPNKFTSGIFSSFVFAIFSSMGSQFLAIVLSIILFIISIIIFFIPTHKFYLFSFSKAKRMSAKRKNDSYNKTNYKNNAIQTMKKNENIESWTANINIEEDNLFNKLDSADENTATDEVKLDYLDDNPFDTTEFEIIDLDKKNNDVTFNDVTKEQSFIEQNIISTQENENNNIFITASDFENYTLTKSENEYKKQKRFSLIKDEEDLNLDSEDGKYGK
ncbi:hypothetical protein N8G13_00105 [Mycoplasma zalophi]|uniref:hypothetical protein n=1 Tax=Mycoplasma zalophi TaxID=191287 RepID=UPI0021C852D1|nr:hypothetical protein [Mycoplasma zalophi]MCU4116872.1 hypothetical protein [Mycoplasma zalophi]